RSRSCLYGWRRWNIAGGFFVNAFLEQNLFCWRGSRRPVFSPRLCSPERCNQRNVITQKRKAVVSLKWDNNYCRWLSLIPLEAAFSWERSIPKVPLHRTLSVSVQALPINVLRLSIARYERHIRPRCKLIT